MFYNSDLAFNQKAKSPVEGRCIAHTTKGLK